MKLLNTLSLTGLYTFWIAFLVNLAMPFPDDVNKVVLYVGLVLLAIHLLEFFIVFKKLKAVDCITVKDFVLVLLVGLFHWVPLLRK